jgi:hypothetical protein
LEYIIEMQTVVEMPSYLKKAEVLFSPDERDQIVAMVSSNPECGELMKGTGGFRKVRVGRGGMGKRVGARVVYILRGESFPIFLVTAYAKNEKENLTKAEGNRLAAMADAVFEKYRR